MYIAIISDLIGSRELADRNKAQQALHSTLEQCNENFKDELAARFTITVGDEFQGLLKPEANPFHILDWIEFHLETLNFRSGIGIGEITTDIIEDRALGADGSAFWNAREAISSVHDHNDYGAVRTRVEGISTDVDSLVNDLLAATDMIKSGWTTLQRETFRELLDLGIYDARFEQKSIAESLEISDVALYKRLRSSQMKLYLRSRGTLHRTLIQYIQGEDGL